MQKIKSKSDTEKSENFEKEDWRYIFQEQLCYHANTLDFKFI